MGKKAEFLSVLLLGSGVVLTAVGLAGTFAFAPAVPSIFFALVVVGIADGILGLILASATILCGGSMRFSDVQSAGSGIEPGSYKGGIFHAFERREPLEQERERMRRILLATGVLSIIFLGLLAAIAFRIPFLLRLMRGRWSTL